MIYNLLYLDEEDYPNRRADIRAIIPGQTFLSINRVKLEDLEVVELDLKDLIGHEVTVVKDDKTEAVGRVVKLHLEKIIPVLSVKKGKSVETNVRLIIKDYDGQEHTGFLFVSPELELLT